MSNIFEQDGIVFIPINRNLAVDDIVSRWFDMLQKKKTPADIFENVQIHNFRPCYVAEYLAFGSFSFDWTAKITITTETSGTTKMDYSSGSAILNRKEMHERIGYSQTYFNDGTDSYSANYSSTSTQIDRGSAKGTVAAIVPAATGAYVGVSDSFFPDENEIGDIIETDAFFKEPELGTSALYECADNTIDYKQAHMEVLLDSKTDTYMNSEISSYYSGMDYSLMQKNVYPQSMDTYAVLIPVWRIDYSYRGESYCAFVKAHIHGKTKLFGGSEQCSGEIPLDENKTKGMIKKIRASKEKKQYKKDSRTLHEQKIIKMIKETFV